MEYNSFYGGRQGASFVIQEKYKNIDEMVNYFKQGNGYKVVNYDEYVIIDTINKNDKDNGKIYRRGYDYNNDMGGAIYVGQIVGPSGLAPHVEIRTVEQVEDMQKTEGFSYRTGNSEYKVTDESIVPGKYIDAEGSLLYNDSIKWVYCSVRDDSDDTNESTAYIGFQIPYTVIDFSAQVTSAYTADTEELSSREDDGEHPFYEKWNLKVPRGIKGDAIKNLREDTDENNNRILVYDSINYNTSEEGATTTSTIGMLRDIENVTITEEGIIKFSYSAGVKESQYQLKYPLTIALDEESQRLEVTYTTGNTELIGEPINYILETSVPTAGANRYHLLVRYNVLKGNVSYNGKNDWFDLGSVKSDSGLLIGGDITDSSLTSIALAIERLNTVYPSGREDGKIMTVGTKEDDKSFYGFNYEYDENNNYKGWYYLGSLGSAFQSSVLVEYEGYSEAENKTPAGGIWMVIEDKEENVTEE